MHYTCALTFIDVHWHSIHIIIQYILSLTFIDIHWQHSLYTLSFSIYTHHWHSLTLYTLSFSILIYSSLTFIDIDIHGITLLITHLLNALNSIFVTVLFCNYTDCIYIKNWLNELVHKVMHYRCNTIWALIIFIDGLITSWWELWWLWFSIVCFLHLILKMLFFDMNAWLTDLRISAIKHNSITYNSSLYTTKKVLHDCFSAWYNDYKGCKA